MLVEYGEIIKQKSLRDHFISISQNLLLPIKEHDANGSHSHCGKSSSPRHVQRKRRMRRQK